MKVEVSLPPYLASLAKIPATVTCEGRTVGAVMTDLTARYASLQPYLSKGRAPEEGSPMLAPGYAVLVMPEDGDANVTREPTFTLEENQSLIIMQAMAGG